MPTTVKVPARPLTKIPFAETLQEDFVTFLYQRFGFHAMEAALKDWNAIPPECIHEEECPYCTYVRKMKDLSPSDQEPSNE